MAEAPFPREEIHRTPIPTAAFGIVEKPLSTWERITNMGGVRKLALLLTLALIWEIYARWLNNPLLFPTFGATFGAFFDAVRSGELPQKAVTSLRILLVGYAAGAGGETVALPTGTAKTALADATAEIADALAELRPLVENGLPTLEKKLEALGAPWTPGRLPKGK